MESRFYFPKEDQVVFFKKHDRLKYRRENEIISAGN